MDYEPDDDDVIDDVIEGEVLYGGTTLEQVAEYRADLADRYREQDQLRRQMLWFSDRLKTRVERIGLGPALPNQALQELVHDMDLQYQAARAEYNEAVRASHRVWHRLNLAGGFTDTETVSPALAALSRCSPSPRRR